MFYNLFTYVPIETEAPSKATSYYPDEVPLVLFVSAKLVHFPKSNKEKIQIHSFHLVKVDLRQRY